MAWLNIKSLIPRAEGAVLGPASALLAADAPPRSIELFGLEQLARHARQVAADHVIDNTRAPERLLPRLRQDERVIQEAYALLSAAAANGRRLAPAAEWLLDNAYLFEEQIILARQHLPRGFSKELPRLAHGPRAGFPRVYDIAVELVSHTDGRFDESDLARFVAEYQTVSILRLGELWAIPIMVRLALLDSVRHVAIRLASHRLDRDAATEWALRFLHVSQHEPKKLIVVLADLVKAEPPLTRSFVTELAARLQGQHPSLGLVLQWLEHELADQGQSLEQVLQGEGQDAASDQASISNSIGGLRAVSSVEWREFVEAQSVVEKTLRAEPAAVYPQMDFHTRDTYRHVVERLRKRSKHTEGEVADAAVAMAREAATKKNANDPRPSHVGYYLIGDGLRELEKSLRYRRTLWEAISRGCFAAGGLLYASGIFSITAILVGVICCWALRIGVGDWALALKLIPLILLASQAAVSLINWLVTALTPPKPLPRMNYATGIPADRHTAVAVPTLLGSAAAARELVDALEVRYLANRDPGLAFALLTDFPDAATETVPSDAAVLDAAVAGIRRLNAKYSAANNPFFLFHRPRKWNASEGAWIGHERKRGKVTDFNAFLAWGDRRPFAAIEGDSERLRDVRYVIVLDTDTQLPPESAWKLVGTLAHPLNEAHVDPATRVVDRGYGLLQPRVSVNLSGARRSRYARLFSDDAGIDPYTREVSDLYQDLFHEASFIGKGIFDVRVFDACLTKRFPENTVLSHDLLEGSYTRCGFVGDVELIEDHPSRYTADVGRRHRWVRGDWQIIGWLLSLREPLSLLSRWKMFDNLRRSLLPAATLALFLLGWFALPRPGLWAAITLGLVLLSWATRAVYSLANKPSDNGIRLHLTRQIKKQAIQLVQLALEIIFLPYETLTYLNAVAKTFWRKTISHRRLLEWQTAAASERGAQTGIVGLYRVMWTAPASAVVVAALLERFRPEALASALPLLACWCLSPLLAWWISRPLSPSTPRLDADDTLFLRGLARRTWSYYERYATEKTHWLPADNFQEEPVVRLAERTSPTNIGMGAVSALAAWDFGFVTTGALLDRTGRMFDTLDKLERHQGHFLNWYDTRTLAPLPPRYVSTVDSGNLSVFLLVLRQGFHELQRRPILPPQWLDGLRDTARILREEQRKAEAKQDPPNRDRATLRFSPDVEAVLSGSKETPPTAATTASFLDQAMATLETMGKTAQVWSDSDPRRWWFDALQRQCVEMREELTRFIPWGAPSATDLGALGQALITLGVPRSEVDALQNQLRIIPRLDEVAHFEERFAEPLQRARATSNSAASPLHWIDPVIANAKAVGGRARERIKSLAAMEDRCRDLAAANFAMLFDRRRKLFSIGYHLDHHRLDPGHYDLLASEARLASYLAIAQGQAPQEHWFLLNRGLVPVDGTAALVSWAGSMFEYLMPLLVAPMFEGTLLDETCRAVIKAQMEYGRASGVPWGMSESGYNLVDAQLNYQYRAFGTPRLGLKRGLADDMVVAPYASAMATMMRPDAALQNLRRMEKDGLFGACGLYEAVDYTPRRLPDGDAFVVVRSFMAHHSGMTLLSLAYTLLGRPMQKRFLADPEFRSVLLLLQERVPTTEPKVTTTEAEVSNADQDQMPIDGQPTARTFANPSTLVPAVGLLGNGRYHVMLTSAGGGYSRWNEYWLTRWRADGTQDNWGLACYLRDVERNRVWSAAHQPTCRAGDTYEAVFSQGKIEFHRTDDQIETHMEVGVSPEDDVEVRRIKVTNLSRVPRRIELTTCGEVVLAPLASDMAHRTFSNLFVETQLLPDAGGILCTRRARTAEEQPPWMFHMATGDAAWGGATFETDRAVFIGRGRTPRQPAAMTKPGNLLGGAGAVLDPIVAIRREAELAPGQTAELLIVTGAAANRAAATALMEKYKDRRLGDRVFETAWTHNQVLLHQINAAASDTPLFNRLAGALVYAESAVRAPAAIISRNRRGQSGLWGQGVSGDLPIILLTISDLTGVDLAVKVAQAHTWWRAKGLRSDLMILVDEGTGYRQNLLDQIVGRLSASAEVTHLDKPGGVFVRMADKLTDDDRTLLQAAARLTLSDRAGSLFDQAERQGRAPVLPPALQATAPVIAEPPGEMPRRELQLFNGLGGFTADGREYVIRLEPGQTTPAPWANVIANGVFGTVVSESGGAYTWSENAHEFRLTPWHNDPISDTSGEAFYIRDEASGRMWSPSALPARGIGPYICRHGQGYSIFEHDEAGIFSEATTYVAIDAPVKFTIIKLRNHSGRTRRVSVTGYTEWVLGEHRDKNAMHVVTKLDSRTGALFASNAFNQDFSGRVAFMHRYPNDGTYTGDRAEFIGRNGTLAAPAALRRQRLSNRVGVALDPCAALQSVVEIPDGQERQVIFMLGCGKTEKEAMALLQRFRGPDAVRQALEGVWEQWKRLLGAVYIETPDAGVNVIFNQWTLYQTIACRIWGRSGYYQSGGAFGFRDQLQDTLALLHSAPWLLREQLLLCASRQFREGDVQHWWHPPQGRGVRTHFSDDYLWLPHGLCRYVLGTGDTGVMSEEVHFLEGRAVKPEEEAYYDLPKISEEHSPLYDHCVRAIRRALTLLGPHGLPLMGCGDWNDGMNKVGEHGRGESVWLAFFLYDILVQFQRLAALRNDTPIIDECKAAAEKMARNIEAHGWDGQWYRRAYFDDGTPLGSAQNEECQVDSLAQSWAVISGAGDPARARQAMDAVAQKLIDEDLRLIKLFTPPFDKSPVNPGYIKGYIPGVRENGGQYTHAAVWTAMAYGQLHDAKRAWECLSCLMPSEHARTPEEIAVYKVEPYAIVADIYTNPQHPGRGGWTWYTGSAGMMYRLILETLLGLRLEVDTLTFAPVLPAEWKECGIHYRYRETVYHITLKVLGPETWNVRRVTVDGAEQTDPRVHMIDDHQEHRAEVEVG